MFESGFRISDLKNIPTVNNNLQNKIALDNTFILSYSHSVYGINYNKQNYKIPLDTLRDDLKGYIGIESIVAPWSEPLKLWHGFWSSEKLNKSYVHVWSENNSNHIHYNPTKFSDLDNSYYIIKDAPYPYESGELNNRDKGEMPSNILEDSVENVINSINLPIQPSDIYPESNKIVTKSYIDERLSGKRIVEVSTEFYIRDYDCTYIIRGEQLKDASEIKIHFPESFNKKILHNKLEFSLLLEGQYNEGSQNWISYFQNPLKWSFYDHDKNEIQIIWLKSSDNTAPAVNNSSFYGNSRYFVIRFETVTNNIITNENNILLDNQEIAYTYNTIADFNLFGYSENEIQRFKSPSSINGEGLSGSDIIVDSPSNTISISSKTDEIKNVILSLDANLDIASGDNYLSVKHHENPPNKWSITLNEDMLPDSATLESVEETIWKKDDDYIITEGGEIKETETETETEEPEENEFIFPTKVITVDNPNEERPNDWRIGFNSAVLVNNLSLTPKDSNSNIEIIPRPYSTESGTIDENGKDIPIPPGWDFKVTVPPPNLIEGNGIFITKSESEDVDAGAYVISLDPSVLGGAGGNNSNKKEITALIPTDKVANIDLSISNNKLYYTSENDIELEFSNKNSLSSNQVQNAELLFKPTEDSYIEGDIEWVMTSNGNSPLFIKDRIYSIKFTYIPAIDIFNNKDIILGEINWFNDNF